MLLYEMVSCSHVQMALYMHSRSSRRNGTSDICKRGSGITMGVFKMGGKGDIRDRLTGGFNGRPAATRLALVSCRALKLGNRESSCLGASFDGFWKRV